MDIKQSIEQFVPDGLKYGIIYLFTNLYTPGKLLDDYVEVMGRVCKQTRALREFEIKVIYVDVAPMLVARRFNAGNIGKMSLLTCPVCGDISIDNHLVTEFVKRLFDFKQLDSGDSHITVDKFLTPDEIALMRDSLEFPDLEAKLNDIHELAVNPPELPEMIDEEYQALNDAERLRDQYLDIVGQLVTNYVLLTHSDPHALLGDALEAASPLVFAPVNESRLTIDSDLRIWLTDYDNAEINLHPLSKALYILFLLHLEGIELRNISEHSEELRDIYEIIMPSRDDEATKAIIDNVCNPLTGTLVQNLSRIKRRVKTIIMDDTMAQHYIITGKRGEAYGISLPRNLVTIPRAFSSND